MKISILIALCSLACHFSFAQLAQNKQEKVALLKQQINLAKEDTAKVKLLLELSSQYTFILNDSSILYTEQAIELSRKINDKKGEIAGLGKMTGAYSIQGDFTKGLYYGFQNLECSKKLQDSALISFAHIYLLICYLEQEDYKEALKYGYQALNASKKMSLSTELGFSLGFLGFVYEKMNQLDSALYYSERSFEIMKSWPGMYLVVGNVYAKQQKYDLGLKYYKQGLQIVKDGNHNIDVIDICNKLSILYENKGKRDSAIYYAHQSLQTEGIHFYPGGELLAKQQLAHLYELASIKDSTIYYLKAAEALRSKLFDRQKAREVQSIAFNKTIEEQKFATQKRENQNKTRTTVLGIIIMVALLLTLILWRNNQHKQKANKLLFRQKEEINFQREKVEKAYSELAKTHEILKATQTQLIQKEKLSSLGELTAGIAHEIQNPLNFVNNFSELSVDLVKDLKDEIEKSDIDKEYVGELFTDLSQNQEKINHHGKRASSIVKGMLEHSRASTGVKELTDINKLADEYLRLSYHGLRAKDKSFNADFTTDFDENLPETEVIPQDIGRVLLNLINNAFYAVNEKRKQNTEGGYKPTVSVSTKQLDNQIIIKIKDNGIGMSEVTKAKVFQPFFTTKPTGQGTGLGLSLAYDIVTKGHGGTLEVNSTAGVGSEFIITLPFKTNSK